MMQKRKKSARLGVNTNVELKDGNGRGRLQMLRDGYKKTGTVNTTRNRYDYAWGRYVAEPCVQDVYDYTRFAVGIEISAKGKHASADLGLAVLPDGIPYVVQTNEVTWFDSEAAAADAADKWVALGGVGVILEDEYETKRKALAARSVIAYPKASRLLSSLSDEDIRKLAAAGEALIEKRKPKPPKEPKPKAPRAPRTKSAA
jgi:hypothetical protein